MNTLSDKGKHWVSQAHPAARSSMASVLMPETIHERSARLQHEQHLPPEVRPDQAITPIRTDSPLTPPDPYSTPNTRQLVVTYGEHQFGAFAYQYSAATLREIAGSLGIVHPGRSRAAMVSAITARVTDGRYSANFDMATTDGAARSKAGGARSSSRARAQTKVESLPPLVPIRTDLPLAPPDPYSPPDPATLIRTYGVAQLARALHDYSVDSLKQTASKLEARYPGTKPKNRGHRAALIAYIVEQSTKA